MPLSPVFINTSHKEEHSGDSDIQKGPENARVHFCRSFPQLPRNPFNTRRESVKCSLPILPARSRGLVCPCTHKGLTSTSSHLLHSFQPASTSKRALGPLFRPLPSTAVLCYCRFRPCMQQMGRWAAPSQTAEPPKASAPGLSTSCPTG